MSAYLSALLSIYTATFLGFLDDVFDIRWRHKLPIPIIACIPLLIVYFADQGLTSVVVPMPFRSLFGNVVDLGEFCFCLYHCCAVQPSHELCLALSIYHTKLMRPWHV